LIRAAELEVIARDRVVDEDDVVPGRGADGEDVRGRGRGAALIGSTDDLDAKGADRERLDPVGDGGLRHVAGR
jgi:hypothetical protein